MLLCNFKYSFGLFLRVFWDQFIRDRFKTESNSQIDLETGLEIKTRLKFYSPA